MMKNQEDSGEAHKGACSNSYIYNAKLQQDGIYNKNASLDES
jgi:hypothetical protein